MEECLIEPQIGVNNEEKSKKPLIRQIIIETDGNMVRLIKADVAGQLELSAILQSVLNHIER